VLFVAGECGECSGRRGDNGGVGLEWRRVRRKHQSGRSRRKNDRCSHNKEFEDTHVTLTLVNPDGQQQISSMSSQFVTSMLNPSPDAGINSLFELTPWVDVQASTTVAPLTLTALTLPLPTIPTISQVPQAPTPLTTAPSTFLQDLPNFGSLFGFHHRLKTLEANFSEFAQTNQFAEAVSSILGIVERYMDQRMNEVVKEQVKEKVKTSYAMAADLSELELKKVLIEKMESNKSIHRSDEQRNLYKALVDAYEYKEPSAGSDRGSKRRREGKEPESTSAPKEKASKTTGKSTGGSKSYQKTASESAPVKEPMQTTQDLEEPSHQEFETGVADDQPITKASQHPEWFQKQKKPPTLDRAWNKTLPATHESIQPWISDLAKQADSLSSFNELMDTPVDFLAFLINRLKVDTLTPELLAGPTYELMKGSCKSLVKLEFYLEEVYKATTDQLDWSNPEGQQYPHNLVKPLPLIPNSRGRHIIPFDHFINNDLEYLRGGASSRKYITSVTKTNAADYGHIKLIEDLFYVFAVNRESTRDVYAKRRIIAVTELQIVEWHNYKNLDWITVRRDDDKLYKFKEDDFKRLHIKDIEDMLRLLVQGKLTNLTVEERFAFNVSLRMFTRSIVIQLRVEDLQLGVESYQKKLNLTNPDTYHSDLKRKEAYTAYSNPRGFIYQNKDKHNSESALDCQGGIFLGYGGSGDGAPRVLFVAREGGECSGRRGIMVELGWNGGEWWENVWREKLVVVLQCVCLNVGVMLLLGLWGFVIFSPSAVSGVSGAKTRVHTSAPGESEAQNGLPDSILLRIPSLWSTGGGMCRGGGSGDASRAVHLARRSPAEGGDSEASGDGDGVGMAKSLLASASSGNDMAA
nr:hypothetical protein [Tanacetum cinerariifolium]